MTLCNSFSRFVLARGLPGPLLRYSFPPVPMTKSLFSLFLSLSLLLSFLLAYFFFLWPLGSGFFFGIAPTPQKEGSFWRGCVYWCLLCRHVCEIMSGCVVTLGSGTSATSGGVPPAWGGGDLPTNTSRIPMAGAEGDGTHSLGGC